MAILVLAEHADGRLEGATSSVVTAAQVLSKEIHVLIAGKEEHVKALVPQVSCIAGVAHVLCVAAPHLEAQLTEDIAAQMQAVLTRGNYRYALMSSGYLGKRVLPYLAALRNTDLVTDLTAIAAEDAFVRPVYAGGLLVVERLKGDLKLLSIRASAFVPAAMLTKAAVAVETVTALSAMGRVRCLEEGGTGSSRPGLSQARVVIGYGRGVGEADIKNIEALADKLNAAIGATRAAVDDGMAPSEWMLGQTGKIIAPELYIAVGISGAIQHVAGVKDSKVIVAVNKDPGAAIFQIANYGVIGDVRNILPEMLEAL